MGCIVLKYILRLVVTFLECYMYSALFSLLRLESYMVHFSEFDELLALDVREHLRALDSRQHLGALDSSSEKPLSGS